MSTHHSASRRSSLAFASRPTARIACAVRGAVRRARTRMRLHHESRVLACLSPHLLHDIGLTPDWAERVRFDMALPTSIRRDFER